MTYEQQVKMDEKAAEAAAQELQDNQEILQFTRRHAEVVFCEANLRLIKNYMRDSKINQESLDLAYEHTALYQSLAKQTLQENRETIENKIVSLLSKGGSPQAVEHEKIKFKYKTADQLQEQLDELQRRADIRALPTEKIRELAAGNKPAQFQPLPQIMQSRSMLLSASPGELRSLIKKCGVDQINAALARRTED